MLRSSTREWDPMLPSPLERRPGTVAKVGHAIVHSISVSFLTFLRHVPNNNHPFNTRSRLQTVLLELAR